MAHPFGLLCPHPRMDIKQFLILHFGGCMNFILCLSGFKYRSQVDLDEFCHYFSFGVKRVESTYCNVGHGPITCNFYDKRIVGCMTQKDRI